MPEVLEEEGISWKVYQSTDAIGGFTGGLLMDNILRLFAQYKSGPLFEKALLPTVELNLLADVLTDRLPQVSWIVTDFSGCEHPGAPPAFGGVAVAEVLDILTVNPAVWEKTAVIISYDENGGFFDHVPPPVPAKGTADEFITKEPSNKALGTTGGIEGPIGLGFRVPCLIDLALLARRFGVLRCPRPHLATAADRIPLRRRRCPTSANGGAKPSAT